MAKIIERALDYLEHAQRDDGSFMSLSATSLTDFSNCIEYSSGFAPSLILSSLSRLDGSKPKNIRDKLARWVSDQRSPHGSYNYWSVSAKERATLPYPDDLDDTFCALIGLHLHDSTYTSGGILAQAVNILIATEEKPGGPYRTWLVPKTAKKGWLDVDLAVNANVSYFLSIAAEPLPNLNKLIDEAIAAKSFSSPYYPDEYPIIYYISRGYSGSKRSELVDYILSLRHKDGHWGNPLHTALMVSSLAHLGYTDELNQPKEYLIRTQQKDGGWPARAYCIDPAIEKRRYYGGSPALTTAFCIEALHLIEASSEKKVAKSTADERAVKIHRDVVNSVKNRYENLGGSMYSNMEQFLHYFASCDTGRDAILLPYMFYRSLEEPGAYNHELLVTLGLANMYGWLAYTVIDDFLDEEGEPSKLPSASLALRESLRHFDLALDGDSAFKDFVSATFDTIDSANDWEVTNCRFKVENSTVTMDSLPDYGKLDKLADRSIGHALTPVALLLRQGFDLKSDEVGQVMLAIRHYLIARQLNDDLHDWQEDLGRGHITFVVAEVLRAMNYRRKNLDLKKSLPAMQKQFWHETVLEVCQVIDRHLSLSRGALQRCQSLTHPNIIDRLLDGIDDVNRETRSTVTDAKDFIKAYSGKKSRTINKRIS